MGVRLPFASGTRWAADGAKLWKIEALVVISFPPLLWAELWQGVWQIVVECGFWAPIVRGL